ncbi:hypothetical protein DPMN_031136 [Dreissena polymorpha]|uniref:Uncharacterized protein n=1 Tax=Dreissena polymorpha TaxID=45954 RepID=A0A9D4M1B4_DREPO|nr:hypothetical protein DPMN_031136 [Dreissena polymorpha]
MNWVKPGHCLALPGSDAGIAPVSASGVTEYRSSAAPCWLSLGLHLGITGDNSVALPGLHQDKP